MNLLLVFWGSNELSQSQHQKIKTFRRIKMTVQSRELAGKVAIVTGASSGIGKSVAFAFAREGAKVVVANRRIAEGEQTVHEIYERGGEAIFVKTDVSQSSEVEAMVAKTIDIYDRLDYACNNAGIVKMNPLTEATEEGMGTNH
jgi:NAD(P)-dependent dehydrogenase (short-subunit alcohol dehydrogenase family)